ncbi:hypothetical protein GA0070558_12550 [Micromonospora haikouensis]|uniref:Uncharacterized protein n=1 Tax=Micromonospora haikouensis TaxID=686309 RepID=A0A1C4XH21_9ACTN|nr:hypothetical protein [Micromonospora haikouensis]SCF07745.1 hypothetical protein GA0070558_12550 [Micromonospora haikouensis]
MPDQGPVADLLRLLAGHLRRYRARTLQDVATRALREPGSGRAWVVTVLNASLSARWHLYHRPLLEVRRLRSRWAYRRRPATDGSHRRLSLLCPTRNRLAQVRRFVRSVARTAADPSRIELLFYVDRDDPALPGYRALLASGTLAGCRCELLVGDPVGVPAAWNALASAATGELLMMANDDQLYVDHGWDAALDARVTELSAPHPDGLLCLYFDGGQYPEGGRDFPIVTRAWYETLGYFVPTVFSQWEVETWVFDIAERAGRLHAVPGVFVEHLHYQDYKAPFDATYQRHRMTRQKSFGDHALFLRTTPQRIAEAEKLRRGAAVGPRDPATFWFTGYLAENRHRMLGDLAGLPDPESTPHRIPLFTGGGWLSGAHTGCPVVRDVLLGVPEATLPESGAVSLLVLPPATELPADLTVEPSADAGCLVVWYGLRVPAGSTLRVAGSPTDWGPGRCVIVSATTPVDLHGGTAEPSVVVRFTVADPDREEHPDRPDGADREDRASDTVEAAGHG